MLTLLIVFVLVTAGVLAGLIQYFVDFKGLPIYQPRAGESASLMGEAQPDRWARIIAFLKAHWQLVGYLVTGVAGAFLVPVIAKLTNLDLKIDLNCLYDCRCLFRGWNLITLLGYGIISGYSSVRLLRSIGSLFAGRVAGIVQRQQQAVTDLKKQVADLQKNAVIPPPPKGGAALGAGLMPERAAVVPDDYFDQAQDELDKKEYYKGLDLNDTGHLYAGLNRLVTETHIRKLPYKPSTYLYPVVDLYPDKLLRSIYSGVPFTAEALKVMDEQTEALRARALAQFNSLEMSLTDYKDLVEAQYPYNCEHVVPQSWFNKNDPMRGDLHHLFTCEVKCNSFRGNNPYYDFPDYGMDVVREECGKREMVAAVHESRFEPERNQGVVARAVLYFLVRYPKLITGKYTGQDMPMLLDWHKKNGVTEYEKHRNREIYKAQGNRNPFIDFPGLAEKLDSRDVFGAGGVESLLTIARTSPNLPAAPDDEPAAVGFFNAVGMAGLQPCVKNPNPQPWTVWRPAACLKVLLQQINTLAPGRDKSADGLIGDAAHQARQSDHNPWVWDADASKGVVTALDVTHDPAGQCDCNVLAASFESNKDPRIKYVIWNRRIMNSLPMDGADPWTWRPYNGSDPHTGHVHISVGCEKERYDDVSPWTVSVV